MKMKNPEKIFFKTLKIMQNNSYLVLDERRGLKRKLTNLFVYYKVEEKNIFAQKEMGAKNKSAMLKKMKRAGITDGSFLERVEKYKKQLLE